MSYADRLKAEIGAKGAPPPTDKTDKSPFVSSVSSTSGHVSSATPAEAARIRAAMMRLWDRHDGATHPEFREALGIALADPDAALDLLGVEGCL
jgi:hypothetical protein